VRTSNPTFNYLGCHVSYEGEKDIQDKITKFLKILGLLNNVLKPNQVHKTTRLKVYNTLAVPTLIYGSEICTLKKQDKTKLTTPEIKFLRKTAGYTLMDHKQNKEIIQELQVAPIINKIQNYKTKWIHMSQEWMTKDILKKCCNTNLEEREDLEDL
jgi:hypothetical protein